MKKRIKNNPGFLLLTSYMIFIVLIIWTAAFFLTSVNETSVARISRDSLQGYYNLQNGLNCVSEEIKAHSTVSIWTTHHIRDFEGGELELDPNTAIPVVELMGYATIDQSGNYVSVNNVSLPDGTTLPEFEAKVYQDPGSLDYNPTYIILVRGNSPTSSRLFVSKVHINSLFDHFFFYPDIDPAKPLILDSKTFNTYDGKIHANGDIIWGDNLTFNDVKEFSTPGTIKYQLKEDIPADYGEADYSGEIAPCDTENPPAICDDGFSHSWAEVFPTLRSPYYNPCYGPGCLAQTYTYLNNPDLHAAGNKTRLLMEDGIKPWNGTFTGDPPQPTYDNPLAEPGVYVDNSKLTKFGIDVDDNDTIDQVVTIPNTLNQPYNWDKYKYIHEHFQWDYPGGNTEIKYTNSAAQQTAWSDFLAAPEQYRLKEVIKDGLSGGEYKTPKRVNAALMRETAKSNGILITKDSGNISMTINGSDPIVGRDRIRIEGKVVAERKTFQNTNSGRNNEVVVVNMKNLLDAGQQSSYFPHNGIIYTDSFGLAISQGFKIPAPLSIVGEENIYLAGNFNVTPISPGQPFPPACMAVGAKELYTVSTNFFNNPSQNVATLHNPNWPQVSDGNWQLAHENDMPRRVTQSLVYNISAIGRYAYNPNVLERWQAPRYVNGVFVRLDEDIFAPITEVDGFRTRWCQPCGTFTTYCRSCELYPSQPWPYDAMTIIMPNPNVFSFEKLYLSVSADYNRPPGYEYNYTEDVALEITNSSQNWSYHYSALTP